MLPHDLLVPRPKHFTAIGETCRIPVRVALHCDRTSPTATLTCRQIARRLEYHRRTVTIRDTSPWPESKNISITLTVDNSAGLIQQAYRLTIDARGIQLIAANDAGLFYGAATLLQWLAIHPPPTDTPWLLPGARIDDWPDFSHRGVLLDISRDKVPTIATLKRQIDQLASWKINQVQLYMEHTFAYAGHEKVWKNAGALSADDVRELDAYCRERAIELVPNQNSFGHFHRWLNHPTYRPLAECPDGIEHPFSRQCEPFSLCATDPAVIELLADLYDQLLPNFSSDQFNVGLDETFDIGRGRSATECEKLGSKQVYISFLKRIHKLVADRGFRLQYWADIIIHRPDLLHLLPKDATALLWGYESTHPFAQQTKQLADAQLPYYVCPGTSSWNSLAGRAANALKNCENAASYGLKHGATGYLVTDWGDWGHLQPPFASYVGLLAGAAAAWNAARPLNGDDVAEPLSLHAFGDSTGNAGAAAVALGNAYLKTGCTLINGTVLFHLLIFHWRQLDASRYTALSANALAQTTHEIEGALTRFQQHNMRGVDANTITEEYTWVSELLKIACAIGRARLDAGRTVPLSSIPSSVRAPLAMNLKQQIDRHETLWLARNRPEGCDDSVQHLLSTHNELQKTTV